jgi:hypothetical protein
VADTIDLKNFIHNAAAGESLVWYRGFVMLDRSKDADVDALAADAWSLYEQGRALLTQRKLREFTYDYVITKKSK